MTVRTPESIPVAKELPPAMEQAPEVSNCRDCVNAQCAVALELGKNDERIPGSEVDEDNLYTKISTACADAFSELDEFHPEIGKVPCALGMFGVYEGVNNA